MNIIIQLVGWEMSSSRMDTGTEETIDAIFLQRELGVSSEENEVGFDNTTNVVWSDEDEEDGDDHDDAKFDDQNENDDGDITLDEIVGWVEESESRVKGLGKRLLEEGETRSAVNQVMDELAKQYGLLEDMQYELDSLTLLSIEDKTLRKQQTQKIEALFVEISNLEERCNSRLQQISDTEKEMGNNHFRIGNFKEAIHHYSEAIAANTTRNATLYTNRALAYQKLHDLASGLADAKAAVRMDANFLKGYVIISKIELELKRPADAKSTLDSVPLAFQERAEILELRVLTSQSAKELGNAYLKEGIVDEAIRMYTVAIDCDPQNHLLYSNRSAAYQKKLQWNQALKDAEACLRACATFAKGYVHLGRAQVQLKLWNDATATVARAQSILESHELTLITPQLNEIVTAAKKGKEGLVGGAAATSSSHTASSNASRAEAFKERGNACYRNEQYQDAVRMYSQAIAAFPSNGVYYGNRAAAWMMLKEFKRAIADCTEG